MLYIPRLTEQQVERYLSIFPVVGLTGPRQSGKSTLLQNLLPDYQYVSFDDYDVQTFFNDDPIAFMNMYNKHVIFDEAQKAPKIFDAIKVVVDKNRGDKGRFIVSGSSQFDILSGITESLAGRIGLIKLLPLSRNEISQKLHKESEFRGGYPELVTNEYKYFNEWFSAYVETYIQRDVRNILNIGNVRDFRRFVSVLAANTSQVLNMSSYAKQLGVSVPTIKSWISVLEASFVIFMLPPHHNNMGKRITKSPKVYFYDTGLVSYLCGIETEKQYINGPMSGAIFENYIISEVKKAMLNKASSHDMSYFRTNNGAEIDLIITIKNKQHFIEIKRTSTFKPSFLKTIQSLIQPEDLGVLIYNGKMITYNTNIEATGIDEHLKNIEKEFEI